MFSREFLCCHTHSGGDDGVHDGCGGRPYDGGDDRLRDIFKTKQKFFHEIAHSSTLFKDSISYSVY